MTRSPHAWRAHPTLVKTRIRTSTSVVARRGTCDARVPRTPLRSFEESLRWILRLSRQNPRACAGSSPQRPCQRACSDESCRRAGRGDLGVSRGFLSFRDQDMSMRTRSQPLSAVQHVTWRMAFVSSDFRASVSMASSIGRISRSIFRRCASRFTSSITGRDPYLPVPTTRHLHFQGIRSWIDTGVCPNSWRNCFEGCFLRFANLAAVDDHVMFVSDAVDLDRTSGPPPSTACVGHCRAVLVLGRRGGRVSSWWRMRPQSR